MACGPYVARVGGVKLPESVSAWWWLPSFWAEGRTWRQADRGGKGQRLRARASSWRAVGSLSASLNWRQA